MPNRPDLLIRNARRAAELSQDQLAQRLGTTQSAVARLERHGSNPRTDTLRRALAACGQELMLTSRRTRSSIDESQVVESLGVPPGERIKRFQHSYANVRELALAAAESRGQLA